MSGAGLPVSRLIDVTVTLSPAGAQYANVESLCILGSTNVINVHERFKSYGDLTAVGVDFSVTDPEYLAAEVFFAQVPSPTQLYVGRWAETATSGLLVGSSLTSTQQEIATWQAVTSGGFSITVDGGTVQHLSGLDFSSDANLNAVATTINATLTGATIAWNGSRFTVTSATTGITSTVSVASAPSSGTDISTMLRLTSATSALPVAGIAAETPAACLAVFDALTTPMYAYTFASSSVTDDEYVAAAQFIESAGHPHLFGVTTSDAGAIDPASTTDIGYRLKALSLNRTFAQYSANAYAAASVFGRMFTVDFGGQNTTITMAYKTEPDVTPEILTTTAANALDAKNYVYFAKFNNNTNIIVNGTMSSGVYFDDVQGGDWFANRIQTDLFNLIYTTPTKIPQTDAGVHQLVTQAQASCDAAVNNGLVGPGNWRYQGFGSLKTGDYMPTGYYVYAAPIASQTIADRSARKSPPLQIAAIFAGAVQSVRVNVNVER